VSEEEINRKIEFIIEQQAHFAADIQSLREVQAADSAFMRESYHTLTGAVTTIVNLVGKLAEAQERTDAKLAELAARTDAKFAEIAQAQARTDAKVAELAEAQVRTDERLNIFINIVEKYISRNGGNKPEDSG
jgi:hypothetical protein